MLANFIEETCSGTSDVLTLLGATQSKIAASEAFADGATVYYVVEDADGITKVAGSGLYTSAGNTITRDDSWSWNGTVYDNTPASNIALTAGVHTIRVAITKEILEEFTKTNSQQVYVQLTEPTDWKVGDAWIKTQPQ